VPTDVRTDPRSADPTAGSTVRSTAGPPAGKGTTRGHFRPDIQGLRALAVGLVILAHCGFTTFAGGFVGVDVFFVISGFLITSLLVREARRTGRISLLGFYSRRARRILPAATLVLVATVLASLLFLPLVRAVEVIKDSIWAAAFGPTSASPPSAPTTSRRASPLPRCSTTGRCRWRSSSTWSGRCSWSAGSPGPPARRPARCTPDAAARAVGVLSLPRSPGRSAATYESPTTAYFSTLTRAWELGIGSALAIWMAAGRGHRGRRAGSSRRWARPACWRSSVACLVYTPQTPFPGYQALLPVLGTAALSVRRGAQTATNGPRAGPRLMSVPPAVVVGDWSYSLYLWHWPVLRISETTWAWTGCRSASWCWPWPHLSG
jgi:peptidoglycan/LPS O-acetylase OafA/YrhL